MRRNLDLIRLILLTVEAAPGSEIVKLTTVGGYNRAEVRAHIALLVEAGLLRTPFPDRRGRQDWIVLRLSWTGYDMLDRIRDPRIWKIAKAGASKVGSWSLETVGALAKAAVAAKAAELGVPHLM